MITDIKWLEKEADKIGIGDSWLAAKDFALYSFDDIYKRYFNEYPEMKNMGTLSSDFKERCKEKFWETYVRIGTAKLRKIKDAK